MNVVSFGRSIDSRMRIIILLSIVILVTLSKVLQPVSKNARLGKSSK